MSIERTHRDNNDNSELTDHALVEREESERREYLRLEQREPHLRDTTYGAVKGAPGLIVAWERWWATKVARRLRGLISTVSRIRSDE
jgi:hypothetical protein